MDSFKEELTVTTVEPRNWKGILIALLVILSICTVITGAILLLSPRVDGKKERLPLEEVLVDGFTTRIHNLTWISSRKIIYRDPDGSLMIYDIATKWKTILASNASLGKLKIERFSLSSDKRYVLLIHDVKKTTSHSFKARYKVYDTKNSVMSSLTAPGLEDDHQIEYADWGPTGSQMVLIHKKDIILFPKFSSKPIQVTNTGKDGNIYNGVPDVMYEEFVLRDYKALWWNEDGTKFCFASFDNTAVDQMPIVIYGSPYNLSDEFSTSGPLSYPKIINYPYPKPGRNNPIVTLKIALVRPASVQIKNVHIPSQLEAAEYYIKTVNWIGANKIAVVWLKRPQNYSVVTLCEEETDWHCEMLLEEHLNTPHGWLDIKSGPLFSNDKEYYFIILPVADGSYGTFDHIIMFIRKGNKRYHLTHGQFVVTQLYTHRSDLRTLYYQATVADNPAVRHIFSITDTEHPEPRTIKCLSCDLSPSCTHNLAKFSPDGEYFILECLGPGIPRSELRYTETNELKEVLNTFPSFEEQINSRAMPRTRYFTVAIDEDIFGRVRLLLPPGLDEDDTVKYPIIVKLNNEPEDQAVSHINRITWDHYLASKREYIVASIDVRGSGFQGDSYKHSIYHNIGDTEAHDIIEVIKFLKSHVPYVEEDKIALWGSEIGGYMVASLMIKDPAFNCGIAISPVTSWRNYASFFMEKTMGLPWPQDNYINYDKSDLFRSVSGLKDKAFMIIHGTADTKVNIQHSMLLIKALTDRGIPFRVQLYPDGEHSLYDEQFHLYKTMEDFFARCFQSRDDQDEEEMELPITKVIKGGKKIITGEE
ncbi:inactive dipeptidyl peptidase 10 [Tetranychus urticae]|uniref:Venom dipeptidyl peptidase 4 n=1 Tax=Tetranychus urticae TaxID=32264 RepID=T1KEV5_TETUR|nr:inactive dipeptidyl peptidase 10 [Tetranychus urticae]